MARCSPRRVGRAISIRAWSALADDPNRFRRGAHPRSRQRAVAVIGVTSDAGASARALACSCRPPTILDRARADRSGDRSTFVARGERWKRSLSGLPSRSAQRHHDRVASLAFRGARRVRVQSVGALAGSPPRSCSSACFDVSGLRSRTPRRVRSTAFPRSRDGVRVALSNAGFRGLAQPSLAQTPSASAGDTSLPRLPRRAFTWRALAADGLAASRWHCVVVRYRAPSTSAPIASSARRPIEQGRGRLAWEQREAPPLRSIHVERPRRRDTRRLRGDLDQK